ncbi:MAG: hypothetical protein HOD92_24500 [Deltaproteobacteria bacterium]|nr:hypothetical protein [Deltaproteobacteria bacterium]
MQTTKLSRRHFLKLTAGLTITTGIGSTINSCSTPYDWQNSLLNNDHSGHLTVNEIIGMAKINGKKIYRGNKLANNADISLLQGMLRLSLPDKSIIELNHKATIKVDLDSKTGGMIHHKKGALLSVIQKKTHRPLIIKSADVQFGIRGTVCFTQILSDEDKLNSRVPQKANSYFCICNGAMDYLDQQSQPFSKDRANHHSAHFLIPGKNQLELQKTRFLLNHSDEHIYELIQKMEGKKHDTRWLFPKVSYYD